MMSSNLATMPQKSTVPPPATPLPMPFNHTVHLDTLPLNVLYQDDTILVVQTLAYAKLDEDSVSEQMLTDGISSYGAFNLGLHVEDNQQQVLANRCALLAMLNDITDNQVKQIHWLNQVHGNTLVNLDKLPKTEQTSPTPQNADALTCTRTGQALAIMTADCVPIMLHDEQTGRIAAVHAGWQGLANGVIGETVNSFFEDATQAEMDCTPLTKQRLTTERLAIERLPLERLPIKRLPIKGWIGACISGKNYEVSRDVLQQLVDGTLTHFPTLQKRQLVTQLTQPHDNPTKTWINLPALAQCQLESLGVQVMTKDVPCSYANSMYYSHRRATHKQQRQTGRMSMLIMSY